MDTEQAILALSALAQSTRLETFRLLARHEPHGLAAGDVAKSLCVPQNTMSSHLAVLTRAGLARARKRSRSVIYRADLETFRAVAVFLLKDCCGGRFEACADLVSALDPCCPATPAIGAEG